MSFQNLAPCLSKVETALNKCLSALVELIHELLDLIDDDEPSPPLASEGLDGVSA